MDFPHEDRLHARFSLSSAYRWISCNGYIPLLESLGLKSETTPSAKKGNKQHETNEHALNHFLAYKITGLEKEVHWKSFVKDDSSCDFWASKAIEIAELYVKLIWEKVLEHSLTGKAWGIEDKLVLDEALDCWGTCDFWAININDQGKRQATIVDYKNGHHIVPIEKNYQLMGYCLAMLKEIRRGKKDLDVFRTVIIQPNADCDIFREETYTVKQICTFETKLYKAIRAIMKGSAKCKVGEWCEFCPCMPSCVVHAKDLQDKSGVAILSTPTTLPPIETLPDEIISKIALHSKELKDYAEAARAYAIKRFLSGKAVVNTKVIAGVPGKRSWLEDDETVAKGLIELGLDNPWRKELVTYANRHTLGSSHRRKRRKRRKPAVCKSACTQEKQKYRNYKLHN